MSEVSGTPWTINELAQRAGMSVRNIRAHQSRGFIPPPHRRGRVAYYGPQHERALARVRDLQRKGYNLAAVEEMLDEHDDRDMEMLRLVLAPLLENEEVVLTHAEMAAMYGLTPSARRLELALDSDLIRDLGNGRYAVPSRRLLNAVLGLVNQGMSILDVYDMQLGIARGTRDVARRFVENCLRDTWQTSEDLSIADTEVMRARFEELRDQFTVVLAATFAINVQRATSAILAAQRAARPPVQ